MTRGQLACYAEMMIWVTSAGAGRELYRGYIDARTGALGEPDRMRVPVPAPDPERQQVTS